MGGDTASILGMQFSYEIAMLAFGGYTAVCLYMFQSISAFIAASVIGVAVSYWLLPKRRFTCQQCIDNEKSEKT